MLLVLSDVKNNIVILICFSVQPGECDSSPAQVLSSGDNCSLPEEELPAQPLGQLFLLRSDRTGDTRRLCRHRSTISFAGNILSSRQREHKV